MEDYIAAGMSAFWKLVQNRLKAALDVLSAVAAIQSLGASSAVKLAAEKTAKEALKIAFKNFAMTGGKIIASSIKSQYQDSQKSPLEQDAIRLGDTAYEASNGLLQVLNSMDAIEAWYKGGGMEAWERYLSSREPGRGGGRSIPLYALASPDEIRNNIRDKIDASRQKVQKSVQMIDLIMKNLAEAKVQYSQYDKDLNHLDGSLNYLKYKK